MTDVQTEKAFQRQEAVTRHPRKMQGKSKVRYNCPTLLIALEQGCLQEAIPQGYRFRLQNPKNRY